MENSRYRLAVAIRRGLFPVFLLTIFWQTRVALWARYQLYDYSIPFIYLSDILILVLLIASFWEKGEWLVVWLKCNLGVTLLVVLFGVVVLIPAGEIVNPVGFTYRAVKLLVFSVYAIYLALFLDKRGYARVLILMSLGLVPIVFIAILQVLLGVSVGSHILGIWEFSSQLPGIATVRLGGETLLRAYGTFAHPNVMGGVLAAFLIYWYDRWQNKITERKLSGFVLSLFGLGLLLTFSRGAWVATIIAITYLTSVSRVYNFPLRFRWKWWLFILVGLSFMFVVMWPRITQIVTDDQLSLSRRVELNNVAVRVMRDHAVFGVGVNQFIYYVDRYWQNYAISRFVQPVHNVYLLVLAENGILGGLLLLVLGLILIRIRQGRVPRGIVAIWVVVGVTGLFDHYWLTIQTGQLFIFLTLGLTLATIENDGHR